VRIVYPPGCAHPRLTAGSAALAALRVRRESWSTRLCVHCVNTRITFLLTIFNVSDRNCRVADKSLARPTSLSIVFSVQGTSGSPTGPDPENRVDDQDIGSPR
jgi:hypothetical protein